MQETGKLCSEKEIVIVKNLKPDLAVQENMIKKELIFEPIKCSTTGK